MEGERVMFWTRDKFNYGFLSFYEFCISESLRPMNTKFGTDSYFMNEEWFKQYGSDGKHIYWTFFRYEKYYYCVVLDGGNIGFATADVFDNTKINNYLLVKDMFNFNSRDTSSASKVFSYVIFVAIQGIKKFNWKEFYFYAQQPALGSIYKRMVYNNKFFLDSLKKEGFVFDREENERYYFKKEKV
jgi:hypothetical protein